MLFIKKLVSKLANGISSGKIRFRRLSKLPKSRQILSGLDKDQLIVRYSNTPLTKFNYATVRDYCDSADHIPTLMQFDGDLKDVQRPWALKAILACLAPGSKLLEIGAGEPIVAGALAELGYEVTVVDPYEGAGNGPVEYQKYVKQFPNVHIIKGHFTSDLPFAPETFDSIYSISVLEHIPLTELPNIFLGIKNFLHPGGYSIHCVDSVIEGNDTEHHYNTLKIILNEQSNLANPNQEVDIYLYDKLLTELRNDLETFYLSAHGHHVWRNGTNYDQFPFRKVVSIQSCMIKG